MVHVILAKNRDSGFQSIRGMASPIFRSKPSSVLTIIAVLRGIQLAILGIYRSLQNPKLYVTSYYEQAFVAIVLSIVIQCALRSPFILLKLLAYGLANNVNPDPIFELVDDVFFMINFGGFAVSFFSLFSRDFDNVFLESVFFIDSKHQLNGRAESDRKFHLNLVQLRQDGEEQNTFWDYLKSKYAFCKQLVILSLAFFKNMLATLIVYFVVQENTIGPIILGVLTILNLANKIGFLQSMFVFGVLLSVPTCYCALFWNTFWGSKYLMPDLLIPFFSRVRFTKIEKEHWIKSRAGVLFGFSLFIYLTVYQFPWICILIYGFAQSATAYLITKVSDTPPNQVSQLVQWSTTQLVWDKEQEKRIIGGEFVDDVGFFPIPGSFIFT